MWDLGKLIADVIGADAALIIVALAVIDYVQVRYLESRLERFERRVSRLEGILLTDNDD